MLLRIRVYGDPVLRAKCKKITEITDEIKELAYNMVETSDKNNGIGLSANQVGVSLRLFVLRNYFLLADGTWAVTDPLFFINPRIVSVSEETESDTEGCLSIPGLRYGPISRPIKLTIEAQSLNGQLFTETWEGRDEIERLNARVRLHENDHINGVLFIDRLPLKVRKGLENDLRALKNKYK